MNITEMMKSVRDSFASLAIVLTVYGLVERFLLPKKTKIVVDEGIEAELVAIGKKGNPKAVYVSSKKNRINFRGAVIFSTLALVITKLIAQYEENHNITIE